MEAMHQNSHLKMVFIAGFMVLHDFENFGLLFTKNFCLSLLPQ
jgi:hypothetical protein